MQKSILSACLILASGVLLGQSVLGQSVLGQGVVGTSFEVASVKPSAPPSDRNAFVPSVMRGGPGTTDPGQLTYTNVPLKTILMNAFAIKAYQVSGPGWLDTERYDITAKIPAGTTKEQLNAMLQNLLKERFHLAFHRESKELPVYELIVAKNGPKLKEAAPAVDTAPTAPNPAGPRFDKEGFPDLPAGRTATASAMGRDGHRRMAARKQTMQGLATALEPSVDRPVLDKTGLTGEYDFKLDFAMFAPAKAAPGETQLEEGASVFTAVQEQLGLKLESKKDPIEQVVIDNADKIPTGN